MKQQTELVIQAIRQFIAQSGWDRSACRIFARVREPDGIYVGLFTDECRWPRPVVMRDIQDAVDSALVGIATTEPAHQAIVSLEPLADAKEEAILAFLGFREVVVK